MVAISNQSGRSAWNNCRQRLFTVEESDLPKVIPVEIQEIEHKVDKIRFRSGIERILQSLKTYAAIRSQSDHFAIEPCSLDRQRRRCLGNPL